VLEATVMGPVQSAAGTSDNGMVQDFGDLKLMMQRSVADPWDHAFLYYDGDTDMIAALICLGDKHKSVSLDFVPTVENLVRRAANLIIAQLMASDIRGVHLQHVRLYETPNCWADWYAALEVGEVIAWNGKRLSC
jgi:6-pyruvoyltetrahydropterin/6-carboxytetrahydropterin synthase